MINKNLTNGGGSPLKFLVFYLSFSFFLGLIFSVLACRAKYKGNTYFWWWLLSIVCISLFSFISYIFFKTSSPTKDVIYYYLGLSTLIANVLAVFILISTLIISKKSDNGLN